MFDRIGVSLGAPEIPANVPDDQRQEILRFHENVRMYRSGEMSEDAFRVFRIHNGVYGVRFREDMHMLRVKARCGVLTSDQMECLARVAKKFGRGRLHLTTRQNVQVHWVPLDLVPHALAELAGSGLTTRESGGNSIRNITCCPFSGVDADEPFDVTPYAEQVYRYFLRHPLGQDLPRKFKVSFSGCRDDCVATRINDIGFRAVVRRVPDAGPINGFRVFAGGGLSSMPRLGFLLDEFVPAGDVLLVVEALLRLFDRFGNRENRGKARLKFVVARFGEETFRGMYEHELWLLRSTRPGPFPGPPETSMPAPPPDPVGIDVDVDPHPDLEDWVRTNARPQKQQGYVSVRVCVPAGDLTSEQMALLASLSRKFSDGSIRLTRDQGVLLRWVRREHLPALHRELAGTGLGAPVGNGLRTVIACPGAETCNLALTNSHALACVLIDEVFGREFVMAEDLKGITVNVSGCPNSCGQHHIAAIGLYGGARKVDGHDVPYYQVVLGGSTSPPGLGKVVARVPAKRIPEAMLRLIDLYRSRRSRQDERFVEWVRRELGGSEVSTDGGDAVVNGKERFEDIVKSALSDLQEVPDFEKDQGPYRDWGDDKPFVLRTGRGECAGR